MIHIIFGILMLGFAFSTITSISIGYVLDLDFYKNMSMFTGVLSVIFGLAWYGSVLLIESRITEYPKGEDQ